MLAQLVQYLSVSSNTIFRGPGRAWERGWYRLCKAIILCRENLSLILLFLLQISPSDPSVISLDWKRTCFVHWISLMKMILCSIYCSLLYHFCFCFVYTASYLHITDLFIRIKSWSDITLPNIIWNPNWIRMSIFHLNFTLAHARLLAG